MSLHKAIASGKEKRKQYYRAKAYVGSCRNHGSCLYCQENRHYKNTKRNKASIAQLEEHFLGMETATGSNPVADSKEQTIALNLKWVSTQPVHSVSSNLC